MKKKEYISPKATVLLLDAEILDSIAKTSPSDETMDGDLTGDGNNTKRIDWEEFEYDDDGFGFGW